MAWPRPQSRSGVVLGIYDRGDGDEGVLVSKVFRMYARYAEAQGWSMTPVAGRTSLGEPLPAAALFIRGEGAFRKLQYESGIHRLQWVPPTELEGRVSTGRVVVAVAAERRDLEENGGNLLSAGTIRTYNLPLDRVTDHRIPLMTPPQCGLVMDGGLDPIIRALLAQFDGGELA